ncbi:MAG TPA: PGF-CTERM sorting domain-containing protein [Candidatus Thermoplasmatota archaeon]|nr:PGF-CTERM sorting domain-containing protein [Candidatus Thermoplasmatota archaeon]
MARNIRTFLAGFVTLAIATSLLPGAFAAEHAGEGMGKTLRVTAHDEGTEYWFEIEGMPGRNPTMMLEPGKNYTVMFHNNGSQMNNLKIGAPLNVSSPMVAAGKNATMNVTVPMNATGTGQYWSDPFRLMGMEGMVQYGAMNQTGDPNGNQTGGPDETVAPTPTPGFGAVFALAAIGAALVAVRALRRR